MGHEGSFDLLACVMRMLNLQTICLSSGIRINFLEWE